MSCQKIKGSFSSSSHLVLSSARRNSRIDPTGIIVTEILTTEVAKFKKGKTPLTLSDRFTQLSAKESSSSSVQDAKRSSSSSSDDSKSSKPTLSRFFVLSLDVLKKFIEGRFSITSQYTMKFCQEPVHPSEESAQVKASLETIKKEIGKEKITNLRLKSLLNEVLSSEDPKLDEKMHEKFNKDCLVASAKHPGVTYISSTVMMLCTALSAELQIYNVLLRRCKISPKTLESIEKELEDSESTEALNFQHQMICHQKLCLKTQNLIYQYFLLDKGVNPNLETF